MSTGDVTSVIYSTVPLQVQYVPEIIEIQPKSISQSGSGAFFMFGKGFPMNASASLCMFKFKESILNSPVTFCNATTLLCKIPSWGNQFAAQMAQVHFESEDAIAPAPNPIAVEFVASVSMLQPSSQSIFGGTLISVDGLGFDEHAPEFKCVFLQGTFRLMTQFNVHNPSSGSCLSPFWTTANSANRTYEVKLIYGHDAKELNAGIIELG
jgi:hypothetical protein